MREIKFRTWDNYHHQMWNSESYRELSEMLLALETGDMLSPLMQYTGLKDKNGCEIYEGDIVQEENYKMVGVVQNIIDFISNRAPGLVIWKKNTEKYGTKKKGTGKLKVIGNIYKNPNLLNPAHDGDKRI